MKMQVLHVLTMIRLADNIMYKLVAILLLVCTLRVSAYFCSVLCMPNHCSNQTSCTDCPSDWSISGSECILNNASGWTKVEKSPSLGGTGNMDVAILRSMTCGAYSSNGYYACNEAINIQVASGITMPHHSVRIAFTLWFEDSSTLGSSEIISIALSGETFTRNMDPPDTIQAICPNFTQSYYRIDKTFNHNQLSSLIDFEITNNAVNGSCRWAIYEFILMAKLCDISCGNCFGSNNGQCYDCSASHYWLNFTCYANCPSGTFSDGPNCTLCDSKCTSCSGTSTNCFACKPSYGWFNFTCYSSCPSGTFLDAQNCTLCDSKCTSCYGSSTNCSACQPGNGWLNFTCYSSCPSGTFLDGLNCTSCDSKCTSCYGTSTNCSACQSGNGWLNFTCYSACPAGTYLNGGNCTACDNKCIECFGTAINCSSCVLSGSNTAFLLNFTCYSNCPNPYFNDTNSGSGPNICQSCHPFCASCFSSPASSCTSCKTNYTLSGNTCASGCLSGYTPTSNPLICLVCSSPCAQCSVTSSNCTLCISTPSQHYLLTNTSGGFCLIACPSELYYTQMLNDTCMLCETGCNKCTNSTTCNQCLSASNYAWLDFNCHIICPIGFFKPNSTNCSACEVGCSNCSIVYDNCTACFSTGNTSSYLIADDCLSTCPIGFWNRNSDRTCQPCHSSCYICWGGNDRRCSSCRNSKVQSGNACLNSCDTNFGITTNPLICVSCHIRCVTCAFISTNCSSCTTTGNHTSFRFDNTSSYSQCLLVCPLGFYANNTNQRCMACPLGCLACSQIDNCSSCTTNYSLMNESCLQTCPTKFFSNSSHCLPCHQLCQQCNDASSLNCTQCVLSGSFKAYLLNNSCLVNCPSDHFKQDNSTLGPNLCLLCPANCSSCNNLLNCTGCTASNFLYYGSCVGTCPNDTYLYIPTQSCRNISNDGVILNIAMTFLTVQQQSLLIQMNFTQDLNPATFNISSFQTITFSSDSVTLSLFTITYAWTSNRSYTIQLDSPQFIYMSGVVVTVITKDAPTPVQNSLNGIPFSLSIYSQSSSLVWNKFKGTPYSELQKSAIQLFSQISQQISNLTTQPIIQQFNKAGLGALLFSGAQLTSSCFILKDTQSQNLYEGARLWSNFVYFQTPAWQQNSSKTKYIVSPTVQEATASARLLESSRMLFDMDSVAWRFSRAGFSTFFIFDCYMQAILILGSWLLVLIGSCIQRKVHRNIMDRIWSIFHRFHEITLFYLSIGLVLEWTYFDSSSFLRILSLSACLLFNLYYLCYQLYVYYQLVPLPYLQLGSAKLQQLTTRYGFFIRNIKYQQYDGAQGWSVSHWFRPYNYHLLSYYKKFMMMITIPLFYEYPIYAVSLLLTLQVFQLIRFAIVRPFSSRWRNVLRLCLQCLMLMFFLVLLLQMVLIDQISKNDQSTIESSSKMYSFAGWIGVACILVFNMCFVVLTVIDFCTCCRTNSQENCETRRAFYYQKIKKYQNSLACDIEEGTLDLWVAKGDLNEQWIDQAGPHNVQLVTIETYDIGRMGSGFVVQLKKVQKMQLGKAHPLRQRIRITEETIGTIRVVQGISQQLYKIISGIYNTYDPFGLTTSIIVKTIVQVYPQNYSNNLQIFLQELRKTQQIVLKMTKQQQKMIELKVPFKGFPLGRQILAPLLPSPGRNKPFI